MTYITRQGIIALIKSAVTEKPVILPDEFDIEIAFSEIKRHNIVPLAYDGAVRCGVPKSNPAMQQMFQLYCRNLVISESQIAQIEKIGMAFEAADIDYILLKGCNIKKLYPKPELRVMGDADILIRTEQYEQIVPIMEKLGYTAKLESNHEFVWTSSRLFLELHKYLIPSYNKDYFAYFGNGWRLAVKTDSCKYVMTAEDEFIYIFTHFAKHYRDGGIGCRHVTDLWVYLRAHPNIDMVYVRTELDKLKLLEFFVNIFELIEVWFEDKQSTGKTVFITDFIFESGSWGQTENHILSAEVKNAKAAGSTKGGKRKSLLNAIFPNAEAISQRYTVLNRAPWLVPVFWPVRWVDAMLFRQENIKRRQAERRLATADKIETYQQALEYVGLDFRFE